MDMPKLDDRDRRDILEQLRTLAASYVHEWRWDDARPDAGVVLANIFARQMENTVSKYNRSLHNHYLALLNLLGTRLMPPSPAEGMVSVGVIPGSAGVYIPRGTAVYAAAETQTGRVFYETAEAVYALDTEIDKVFFTSARRDAIVCAYDRTGAENAPFRLFDFTAYPNLQRHALYFRDDCLFCTKDGFDFTLQILHERSAKQQQHTLELLSDPDTARWEYHAKDGWRAVEQVIPVAGGIRLLGRQGSVPTAEDGAEEPACLIRCRLCRVPSGGVYLTGARWLARNGPFLPDALSCDIVELPKQNFSPFGDVPAIFTDFSISSREAFSKPGAVVEVEAELDFFKTPVENPVNWQDNIRYRSLMTEEDFAAPKERDVRIERVQWEYWNGLGWARLFPDGAYEDFFTPRAQETRRRTLTFRCPADMSDVAVGAADGPFIRARIDKLTTLTPLNGSYIVPFVRQITLRYDYDTPVESREITVESNREIRRRALPDPGEEPMLTAGLCPAPAMYLCLTGPLTDGPVRLFWDIEPGIHPDPAPLLWEYYGRTAGGTPGWKSIEVMDLTENATKSAVVTLVGKPDFLPAHFFGSDGYFLRLVDSGRRYDGADPRTNSVVRGIWPNTVPVVQRERRGPEYFYIAQGERHKECSLSAVNVADVAVWVNEQGSLSVKEEEALLRLPDTEAERSPEGMLTGIWTRWQETEHLESAEPEARVFSVDHVQGTVRFGDGRHGRIPAAQAQESIRVQYAVCDGELGNVEPNGILGFLVKPPQAAWLTNRARVGGGAGRETVDRAAARTAGELAGMGRVVTLDDFQRAVLAANRNIFRVKCAAHRDRRGRETPNALAVAVLPREYRQGEELFDRIARDVRRELEGKASILLTAQARPDIFEVQYVEFCVSAHVVIHDYNQYHEVHQAISKRLQEFLDPVTGGFHGSGWEIGRLPGREMIYNCVKTVKHIRWIKGLHIFPYMLTEKGRQPVDLETARQEPFSVPVFGTPEIRLTVE